MKSTQTSLSFLSSERILGLLTALPESRLLSLIQTSDQLQEWLTSRFTYTCVAAAWITRQELQDDPIEPFLKSGKLSQNDYNRIWRLVDYYQRLWVLVQRTEPFMRKKLKQANAEYPFDTTFELFVCIVAEQTNNQFSYCLESYRECSGTKDAKEYRHLAKYMETKTLSKYLERTMRGHISLKLAKVRKNIWSLLLFCVAQENATKSRRLLNDALQDVYTALARLFEAEATHHRIQGSFAWFKGEKVKGSKTSAYHQPKP